MTHLPRATGDERVDRALVGLDRLGESPVSGHVAVFEELHATLEAILAASGDTGERPRREPPRPDPRAAWDRATRQEPLHGWDHAAGGRDLPHGPGTDHPAAERSTGTR